MSPDELKQMLLTQELMAFNVGFFCGSTVFLPIDPRHRIVCPRTNPSRVYTPAGSVSWGGSCMAIYPVDSPGGFQMLGRTVPYFDMMGIKKGFSPERPWLYQSFDIISFYEVTEEQMEGKIKLFQIGRYQFEWDHVEFDMAKHNVTLQETADEVQALKEIRRQAQDKMILAERESLARWREEKNVRVSDTDTLEALLADPRYAAIESPLDANVWKIRIKERDVLAAEQPVCVLEAMKMEISVNVPRQLGKVVVEKINTFEGAAVRAGAKLMIVRRLDELSRVGTSLLTGL